MSNMPALAILAAALGLGGSWAFIERASPVAPARLAEVSEARRDYPVCRRLPHVNCVVDGDTFYLGAVKIRVADIDAPETHPPRCALEADLGDRATRRLSELLGAGPFELVRFDRDTDRYGRKLRVVMRNGRSLGDMLVGEGLARTWTGHREPWCPDGPST
jgi:endonuclease YncB( thermonuclease family)